MRGGQDIRGSLIACYKAKGLTLLWLALFALGAILPESDSCTSLPLKHQEQAAMVLFFRQPAGELEVLCSPLQTNRELFRFVLLDFVFSLTNVLSSLTLKGRFLFFVILGQKIPKIPKEIL